MLAWIISLVSLYTGCTNNNPVLVITAGLFAIAGNISWLGNQIVSNFKSKEKAPATPEA